MTPAKGITPRDLAAALLGEKRSARGDGEVSGRKLYQQGPEGFRAAKKSSPRLVPGASRERKKGG